MNAANLLLIILALSTPLFLGAANSMAQEPKIETIHDKQRGTTTVRLLPIQISGEKGNYDSLHIAAALNVGNVMPPEAIDFELQTVVKSKLKIDLYVVFIVDDEIIFLSSSRSAKRKRVEGKLMMSEKLMFHMPYETLRKIAKAKSAGIKLDGMAFCFGEAAMAGLRQFVEATSPAEQIMKQPMDK